MLYSVRLLLVAIIISANVPVLFANSCIGSGIRIGGAGVLSKHDVVFVGLTVDNKIVQIPASDGKSELWLRKTVLAVKENFKGAETNEMTVYSPATAPPQLIDGQMVGLGAQEFNFKAATEYLVFADVRNGLLFINDSCGQDATRPVSWDFKDWGLES